MASGTRERMIDTAIALLAGRGYQATSFAEVLAASGAPRGSIYHHFPGGKDELIAAALARQADRMVRHLATLGGGTPAEIVAGFLAMWRKNLVATDFAVGCPLLAVTVSATGGGLNDEAGALFRQWRAGLATLFSNAGVPQTDAAAFAAELLAAAEGVVVIARAERTLEAFDLVAERLRTQAQTLAAA